MNVVTLFVSHPQTSLVEEPIEGRFHDIAILPKPTAMFGVAFGDQGRDSALSQRLADLFFCIVGAIGKYFIGMLAWATSSLLDARNPIYQRDRHLRIVDVGSRMFNGQGCSLSVHNQVTFRAVFAPIRGIWARLDPPKRARTEQLSMAEVDQSIASACPSSSSRACYIFCQRPAACQSRRRRQQVMPQPQPISRGRYSHGVPVLRTNRIPVKQARSGIRGRPPLGLGGSGGICGSMRSHSSSVSSGLAIAASSMTSDYRSIADVISDEPLPFL